MLAKLRGSVFIPVSVLFFIALFVGMIYPEKFFDIQTAIVLLGFQKIGWLFQVSALVFLGICIYLTFSRYGSIKLGGADAKPDLSTWNWFAISLCSGIGTGILFFGIAEPITHFMNPAEHLGIEAGTEAAAIFSMTQTFIHWGFIPYSMYGLMGIAIAYVSYNLKQSDSISATLYPLFGKRVHGYLGSVVDSLCIFSITCAVAASLGAGVLQMGRGINIIFGIPNNSLLWIILLVVTVVTYVISSYTGLNQGIRRLSDINTKLYIVILIFIFLFGPTTFILSLGTQSTGSFFGNFFDRVLYMSPVNASPWPMQWPIFYYATWIAYAPLIGKFLAKISKGRTIKQFMLMNVMLPSIFGMIWFSVFGGSAIRMQLDGIDIWGSMQKFGFETATFTFLEQFPVPLFTSAIFIFAVFISYVTLADSMTSTIANLTVKSSSEEAPGSIKIYWGVVMATLTIVNLMAPQGKVSGIDAIKQIAIVSGLPLLLLMLLVSFATFKMITWDNRNTISTSSQQYKSDFPM